MSVDTECTQAILRPIAFHLKSIDPTTTVIKEKIKFKGQLYGIKDIQKIPTDLTPVGMKEDDSNVLFCGETCPLSNLFECQIVIGNTEYKSSEHFYQSEKCKSLGKADIAQKVMEAKTPREAMLVGKAVRPPPGWVKVTGVDIMKAVIAEKAAQVPLFRQLLIKLQGKTLVESTVNRVWGNGVSLHSKDALNKHTWHGENLLGKVLSEIQKSLKK